MNITINLNHALIYIRLILQVHMLNNNLSQKGLSDVEIDYS